jgi:hypothetical protein
VRAVGSRARLSNNADGFRGRWPTAMLVRNGRRIIAERLPEISSRRPGNQRGDCQSADKGKRPSSSGSRSELHYAAPKPSPATPGDSRIRWRRYPLPWQPVTGRPRAAPARRAHRPCGFDRRAPSQSERVSQIALINKRFWRIWTIKLRFYPR